MQDIICVSIVLLLYRVISVINDSRTEVIEQLGDMTFASHGGGEKSCEYLKYPSNLKTYGLITREVGK